MKFGCLPENYHAGLIERACNKLLLIPALMLAIVFILPANSAAQIIRQDLLSNWEFCESEQLEWMRASVPGTVHTDLLALGKIPDPFVADHEKDVQWVENKTWQYKTTFDCDKELWKQKRKQIIFEGLDTYADVYLNDSLLFTCESMFISFAADVDHILRKKENTLLIIFHPVSELIEKRANSFSKK